MNSRSLPEPRSDVVFQPVPEGGVLLSTQDEIYFGLNSVGARIWEGLATAATMEELVALLREEYPEVESGTIRRDAEELLSELEGNGLVKPRGRAGSLDASIQPVRSDAGPPPSQRPSERTIGGQGGR